MPEERSRQPGPRNGSRSRSKSSSSRMDSSRRIYQPPILQSGYQGRDSKGSGDYAPFSPNSQATPVAPAKWDRESERNKAESSYDRNHSSPSSEQEDTSFDSSIEKDRSVSYYKEMESSKNPVRQSNDYDKNADSTGKHYDAYNPPVASPHTPRRQRKLNNWYQNRFPVMSKSESSMSAAESGVTEYTNQPVAVGRDIAFAYTDGSDFMKTKQSLAYCSIALTSVQLLILMLQLTMCGVAPLEVNPMVGPFPDAFSEWGGKNPYLMLEKNEWWRLVTPAFLHVGILHLAVNAFCQLEAVAMFEREWGSVRWILIYLCSTLGCSVFSNYFDGNSIAVGSSGSLMGMYAAKLAEVTNVSFFESHRTDLDDVIRLDQLSSVLCGLVLISLLGSFTFIDWSGNMGGLLSGFLAGLILFGDSIQSCCTRFFWFVICLACLVAALGIVSYEFLENASPDEQLADPCEYYRHLYPENTECGCFT